MIMKQISLSESDDNETNLPLVMIMKQISLLVMMKQISP